ncbi:MAG TPA: hypothetical protein VIG41_09255, partial [Micrococcaceae bacterium]
MEDPVDSEFEIGDRERFQRVLDDNAGESSLYSDRTVGLELVQAVVPDRPAGTDAAATAPAGAAALFGPAVAGGAFEQEVSPVSTAAAIIAVA